MIAIQADSADASAAAKRHAPGVSRNSRDDAHTTTGQGDLHVRVQLWTPDMLSGEEQQFLHDPALPNAIARAVAEQDGVHVDRLVVRRPRQRPRPARHPLYGRGLQGADENPGGRRQAQARQG